MEVWTPSTSHPGYIEKTITHGTVTVTIFRPELTEKEKDKRKQVVEAALTSYGRNQPLHSEVTT